MGASLTLPQKTAGNDPLTEEVDMKRVGFAKGAAIAVALSALSACGVGTIGGTGNGAIIGDNFVGASSCSNLSPQGNAVNTTNRDDVRCGPQSVSPIM